MNTKYEFVPGDEIEIGSGRTLKRIRAVVAIAALGLPAGALGGYIESEKCLSSSGDAWVSGDARVSGSARVYDDAQVSGSAHLYGDARVYGNAHVSDDARVYGNAWVYGNAQVYGSAHVYGDARVSGSAQVYGSAWVYGDAQVYGDAWVSGDARVSGDSLICWFSKVGSEIGTLTAFNGKEGLIVTRGCFIGSIDEFLTASEQKHDAATQLEYRLLIEVAQSRITRAIAKHQKTS